MIRCEVIYNELTLKDFDKISDLVRKNAEKNKKGWLYIGDTFTCEKELAEYLSGNNALKLQVIKVIEVIPELETPKETVKKEKKPTRKAKK